MQICRAHAEPASTIQQREQTPPRPRQAAGNAQIRNAQAKPARPRPALPRRPGRACLVEAVRSAAPAQNRLRRIGQIRIALAERGGSIWKNSWPPGRTSSAEPRESAMPGTTMQRRAARTRGAQAEPVQPNHAQTGQVRLKSAYSRHLGRTGWAEQSRLAAGTNPKTKLNRANPRQPGRCG